MDGLIEIFFLAGLVLAAHVFTESGPLKKEGLVHYWMHSIYALYEPTILRIVDWLVEARFFRQTRPGRLILWWIAWSSKLFPHGVCIPTGAAIHLIRDIEKRSGGKAHIAVGPCVCQVALGKYKEPIRKDITICYGSDIYTRFYADDYEMISADRAAEILRQCHRNGLAHLVEFCMRSRQWMFVICNCDTEICCPHRVYMNTGRMLLPGPYTTRQNSRACLGPEECGVCIERCPYQANYTDGGRVKLDPDKCMGCGLCVTTCKGRARTLERREGYTGHLLPWDYIKGADAITDADDK